MSNRRPDDDLAYGESYGGRWDRSRFAIESDRNRLSPDKDRFEEHGRPYNRGPGGRIRETSVDERFARKPPRPWDDDDHPREKRYYDDGPRFRRSPPPELEQRLVIERERDRERESRYQSPPRRPGQLLRRQSSLDTFDRRPPPRIVEREERAPPIRRGDYPPEPYKSIPLPRSRALPPPRIYAERDFDEIKIVEPDRYGDEEFHAYPDRIREREIIKTRRRRDSGESRRKHHGSSARSRSTSRTSSGSDSSSSSGGTAVTAKSEYPKKGKTRIPVRLVSKRALIDLGYLFFEEGNVIIVQKALGQQNIDDLLKLSEEYKKAEKEIDAARSSAGGIIEERHEVFTIPPPPAPVPNPPQVVIAPAPPAPPPAPVEVVKETIIREASPTRTARSYRSHSTSTTRTPVIIEPTPQEISEEIPIGPLALVSDRRRTDREITLEIARLETERDLLKTERHHHHHHHHRRAHSHSHSRHRSHSRSTERELVAAERLPTGELVLYEEQVEKIEEPRRGVRIEKDKKGRMSISVPKYR
ncbi:hypothetical protein AAE478_007475 [Parahypoxylon ruwenzoriense]